MHAILPYMLAVFVAVALAMAALDVRWTIRERITRSVRRTIRRTRIRGAMLFAWALSSRQLLQIAGVPTIAGADGTEIDVDELRKVLGIAETADPVAAIANMRAEIAGLKETIAGDKPKAEAAEFARVRNELVSAQQRLLTIESENAAKIRQIEAERRTEQAHAKVENLVAKGRIAPVNRDLAISLAESLSAEKFDEYVATLTSIDLRERGVATGHDLADLEPTAQEMQTASALGLTRMDIIRQKAKNRGLELPAEVA